MEVSEDKTYDTPEIFYENQVLVRPQITLEEEREIKRRSCRNSLPFLAKEALGYVDIARVHEEMWDFYWAKKKQGYTKFLFLIPRNHLKTTFWSISFPIWSLLNNPNERILLANAVWDNARSFLRSIKSHYDYNENFRDLFGDWQGPIWTSDAITVSKRNRYDLKEPSISTAGVERSVTSQHVDRLIIDDIVERTNVESVVMRERVKDWIRDAFNLLETGQNKNSEVIMLGTRYDDDDAYGWVMEEHSDGWAIYVRQVVEDGEVIFPEKFTHKYVDQLKRDLGSSLFAANYLNEPVDPETALFKKKDFKFVRDLLSVDKIENFYFFMTIDPSYGTSVKSDRCAVIVMAFHQKTGNLYVVESWAGRLGPDGNNKQIIKMFKKYPMIKKIGIETNASQKSVGIALRNLAHYFEIRSFPIFELKPGLAGDSSIVKTKRVAGLQPFVEEGKVFFVGRHPELELELSRFPRGRTDDLVDALSYALYMVPMGRKLGEKKKKELRRNLWGKGITGYKKIERRKQNGFDKR